MDWMFIVAPAWLMLAIGLAVLIGRSVRQADGKASENEPEAPNFIVDRPPLVIAPDPVPPARPAPPSGRDAPTIPALPSARPPAGRPGVPHAPRRRPSRRTGLG
jgi:hypothetical protein